MDIIRDIEKNEIKSKMTNIFLFMHIVETMKTNGLIDAFPNKLRMFLERRKIDPTLTKFTPHSLRDDTGNNEKSGILDSSINALTKNTNTAVNKIFGYSYIEKLQVSFDLISKLNVSEIDPVTEEFIIVLYKIWKNDKKLQENAKTLITSDETFGKAESFYNTFVQSIDEIKLLKHLNSKIELSIWTKMLLELNNNKYDELVLNIKNLFNSKLNEDNLVDTLSQLKKLIENT